MDQQILKAIQWLFLLTLGNTCLLIFGILVGLTILMSGFNARSTLLHLLTSIQGLVKESVVQFSVLNQMLNLSRLQQQRTAETMQQVRQVTPIVVQEVQKVPEVTADKVIEKIKSGDSGILDHK